MSERNLFRGMSDFEGSIDDDGRLYDENHQYVGRIEGDYIYDNGGKASMAASSMLSHWDSQPPRLMPRMNPVNCLMTAPYIAPESCGTSTTTMSAKRTEAISSVRRTKAPACRAATRSGMAMDPSTAP